MRCNHKEVRPMKNLTQIAAIGLACALVAGAIAVAADQQAVPAKAGVSRYSGVASVTAAGKAAQLRVEIKDWHLVRSEEAVKLPVSGFYIAQLKSGEIDTEIAGKKEHRRAGDFWTVAAGESMTISFPPHREAAQIQTMTIMGR
jgi:hypothetical protein